MKNTIKNPMDLLKVYYMWYFWLMELIFQTKEINALIL